MSQALRRKAVELSARFALIGEDAMISVSRAELILDFLASRSLQFSAEPASLGVSRPKAAAKRPRLNGGPGGDEFPVE